MCQAIFIICSRYPSLNPSLGEGLGGRSRRSLRSSLWPSNSVTPVTTKDRLPRAGLFFIRRSFFVPACPRWLPDASPVRCLCVPGGSPLRPRSAFSLVTCDIPGREWPKSVPGPGQKCRPATHLTLTCDAPHCDLRRNRPGVFVKAADVIFFVISDGNC